MIHDGYWQDDLLSLANKIVYWKRKINHLIDCDYTYAHKDMKRARHKLAQSVFFSACIIRKMVEEEIEAIKTIDKYLDLFPSDGEHKGKTFLKLYKQQLTVCQLPLKIDCIDSFDDCCVEDYDFSSSQKNTYSLKQIGNWIIHSYIWSLQSCSPNDKHIWGFVINSDYDRMKFACYIDLETWCDMLRFCAENAYL